MSQPTPLLTNPVRCTKVAMAAAPNQNGTIGARWDCSTGSNAGLRVLRARNLGLGFFSPLGSHDCAVSGNAVGGRVLPVGLKAGRCFQNSAHHLKRLPSRTFTAS